MKNSHPYKTFGELLAKLRLEAGFLQQTDFAKPIGSTQQTVSRWELGTSRPRAKQIPVIANVLKASADTLLQAAGYIQAQETAVATFVQPFPLSALTPENFERFSLYFLSALFPNAEVHRIGGQGHTQDGIDLEAIFPDKSNYTFQCKRHAEFGPSKVKKTVEAHTRKAKKKFILLSRVATPQARTEIQNHKGWEIWDVEDISRKIRQELTKETQKRIVDIFFRGQRLSLIGETESGPWQTREEFFAPFDSKDSAFSHAWDLIGRDDEVRSILENLNQDTPLVVCIVGTGGSGKSRVLKQVTETYEANHKGVVVRFLSPTENVTSKSLEDLGAGRKILVVDDAHDRNDLSLLFQYVANPSNQSKLLLSFRPYGLDSIKAQATSFALAGQRVTTTTLNYLSLTQATELAQQVLTELQGPTRLAEDIARLTLDCPLATVIGAFLVTREKIHPELVKNEDEFRQTLFGKFRNIVAGEIGKTADTESIKKLLKLIAILQPVHPDDASFKKIVEATEGISSIETSRLMKLLTDAGVLFKRGGQYRLSPDLLADFLIEESCIGIDTASTGYAESVFEHVNAVHLEHLLLNLGKLDWRLANGDPSNSRLLDGVWSKLKASQEYQDPCVNAVTKVAYYQPKRALDFAEALMREGKYLRDLPGLIKNAAYNFEYLMRACECLWELGKTDSRTLNQHPGHAIRILSELCSVEPNKPYEYNEAVVDFVLSLIPYDDAWDHAYSPFDILKGILQTEGHTSTSSGRAISFSPFLVSPEFVSGLRRKILDVAIALLLHPRKAIAVKAAQLLSEGLRYPMGVFNMPVSNENRASWDKEFMQTLNQVNATIRTSSLEPVVLIEIVRSISWHAHYAESATTPIAREIIAALPNTLEFRTTLALTDGFGHLLERLDYRERENVWNKYLEALTNDLLTIKGDGENLREFIEERLADIEAGKIGTHSSPYVLCGQLVNSSLSFAQAILAIAITQPDAKTNKFAGNALAKLLTENHALGLDVAKKLIALDLQGLKAAVGAAYSMFQPGKGEYTKEDLTILRELLSSNDPWVAGSALGAVRSVATINQRLAIDLLHIVDFGTSAQIADDVLILLQRNVTIPFESLTEEDVKHFLKKLMAVPELDGYWIETFLSKVSKYHARIGASFFMDRVEHAATTEDWRYRPCNTGPYVHVPLRFRESEEFGSLLKQISSWMRSHGENYWFRHRAGELFEAFCNQFDAELLGFIQDWVDTSTPNDIAVISQILSEAHPTFVFEQRPFVVRFLDKAKQHGEKALETATSALYRSAITGLRSGAPGEPFPEDLRMKEESEKALEEIPRFSPSYQLYEHLNAHAEQGIKRSLQEREAFEEEE